MRFSTFAVSAAIFGVAMAIPAQVVYETEVVTVTSCAPEKTNCPGKVSSSTVAPVPTSIYSSIYTPPAAPTTSCITYANGTASASHSVPPASLPSPVCPGSPHCPPPASSSKAAVSSKPTAATTAYPWVPSASAGLPSKPANTSTPVVPTSPPSFEGAASIKGFSFAAVAMAAAAFVLA